jgi:hypothetical protein
MVTPLIRIAYDPNQPNHPNQPNQERTVEVSDGIGGHVALRFGVADAAAGLGSILARFQNDSNSTQVLLDNAEQALGVLRDLLSEEFSAFYWQRLAPLAAAQAPTSVPMIVAPEDPFPWELVRPKPDPADPLRRAPLLGQQFGIGRFDGQVGGPPLAADTLLVISPTMKPKAASGAAAGWAGEFGDQLNLIDDGFAERRVLDATTAVRTTVLDELRADRTQVVHYMGHHHLNVAAPAESWLPLVGDQDDDGLTPDVIKNEVGPGGGGARRWPWVFINACNAGRPPPPGQGPGWSPRGWGVDTVGLGAHACVAPYWQVRKDHSRLAARMFYEHLRKGRSFGEALRLVRSMFGDGGPLRPRATYLAYSLYGDPTRTAVFAASDRTPVSTVVPGVAPPPPTG